MLSISVEDILCNLQHITAWEKTHQAVVRLILYKYI